MKRLIPPTILLMALLWISCGSTESVEPQSAESEPPAEVEPATPTEPDTIVTVNFTEKFSGASDIDWELANDSTWKASFDKDGQEYEALYSLSGELLETKTEITKKDLPGPVIVQLDRNFMSYEVDEAEVVESTEGVGYEFEIKSGGKKYAVSIDSKGNLEKKED